MNILVTGGCGFIGSHLVDRLVNDGHRVRVLDLLEPQVHGKKKPGHLNPGAEYVFADIRDAASTRKALARMETVFHLAGQVGVAQSMYEMERYTSHNSCGTAVLLDALANGKRRVRKLVVASSMTVYGEGAYRCGGCGTVHPRLRGTAQLKKHDWEMRCPKCGRHVARIATPEDKPLFPSSVYAATKHSQEELCMAAGTAYGLPTVILRFFNAYGPRQSLNNPYTGVAAIFISQVKNGNPPAIFEDGRQSRDFIHVRDVVEANVLAMQRKEADYNCFNVGSGVPQSIANVAAAVIRLSGRACRPAIMKQFRCNDIRHCYADITRIKRELGFSPRVSFQEGMNELLEWSREQRCSDMTGKARTELSLRGLAK